MVYKLIGYNKRQRSQKLIYLNFDGLCSMFGNIFSEKRSFSELKIFHGFHLASNFDFSVLIFNHSFTSNFNQNLTKILIEKLTFWWEIENSSGIPWNNQFNFDVQYDSLINRFFLHFRFLYRDATNIACYNNIKATDWKCGGLYINIRIPDKILSNNFA